MLPWTFLRETLAAPHTSRIRRWSGSRGFVPLTTHEDFYHRWLADGGHAAMAYLAREPERRFDPRRLDPRYKSVVSLGYPYACRATPQRRLARRDCAGASPPTRSVPIITMSCKKRARAVADMIRKLRPGAITRAYVDTGPVFEREWAAEARLGWFGKNTMIAESRPRLVFFPRRDFHRRRIRSRRLNPIASIAGPAGDASICARPARSPTAT